VRTFIRWAARLYPPKWRTRYGAEFDALLDDIPPSFGDVCDVLGHVLLAHATGFADAVLLWTPACPTPLQASMLVAATGHTMILTCLVLASWSYPAAMSLHVAAPLPPPAPDPPAQIADPRVFPQATTLYSSLPFRLPAEGSALFTSVVPGVGINFPPLPDAGATDRRRSPGIRIWPGQALEQAIVRRVLPEYPRGTNIRGAVSVFVEYLITLDGSVRVLRTSGPVGFAGDARSAIERWVYRPVWCEDGRCEAVTRVEVRFDGELARAVMD
jgi:hypothetical protein